MSAVKKYKIIFTKDAVDDIKKIKASGLFKKLNSYLDKMEIDPFSPFAHFKKLSGDLSGSFSRRLTIKHRLVFSIDEKNKTVKILSAWGHYGD